MISHERSYKISKIDEFMKSAPIYTACGLLHFLWTQPFQNIKKVFLIKAYEFNAEYLLPTYSTQNIEFFVEPGWCKMIDTNIPKTTSTQLEWSLSKKLEKPLPKSIMQVLNNTRIRQVPCMLWKFNQFFFQQNINLIFFLNLEFKKCTKIIGWPIRIDCWQPKTLK